MAAIACNHCERPVASACGCSFPLPLLCEEHLTDHSDHNHLPVSASRWIRDEQTQIQLKDKLEILSRLYEPLKLYRINEQQTASNIRERLIEFDRNVKELASIVKGLEVYERESNEQSDSFCSLIWDFPEGELGTWASIGRGLSLQAENKYEESCRVLESRWSEGVEALVLGLALGEVMGLHIGRFREALTVLDRSLQRATQLLPLSETALQITNMKVAVFIHMTEDTKVFELCKETINSFGEEGVSEVTYGTTLYFFLVGTLNDSIPMEIEILIRKWVAKTEGSSNTLTQLIRLCIIAILKYHEEDLVGAESHVKEAEGLAKVHFPNSHFAALCSYSRDYIERLLYRQRSVYLYREEDPCLRTHFPASLLRVDILISNTFVFKYMEDIERFYELHIQAIQILKGNLCGRIFPNNFRLLKKSLKRTNQMEAALDLYYSAIREVFDNNVDSDFASAIFYSLRNFLKKHMPERRLPVLTEFLNKAQATCPERKLFTQILGYVSQALGYKNLEILEEKYLFLRTHFPNSDSCQQSLEMIGEFYYDCGMQKKSIEIYLEGIQFIKTHRECRSYMEIVSTFAKKYKNLAKETVLKVLLEAHQYLIEKNSTECWTNLNLLKEFYEDQPDIILSLRLEVHQVLQLTPTCKEYNENLIQLTVLYKDRNQLESAIQLRLESYQLLLAHLGSRNFIENVDGLAECYETMGQNEAADELRLKVRQLVLSGPPIYLLQRNLVSLSKFGHEDLSYSEKLLELYHLQDGNQAIPSDYERLYCEKGDAMSMIRLLLKCIELAKTLSPNFNPVVKITGDLYLQLGEREAAAQLFVQTLHFWLERHSFRWIYEILISLDGIFEKMKQPERTIEIIEATLCAYEKYEIVPESIVISNWLALMYENSGQRNKQITAYMKTLHYWFPNLFYAEQMIYTLDEAVRCYRNLGEMERIEYFCTSFARICHWPPSWINNERDVSFGELRHLYSSSN